VIGVTDSGMMERLADAAKRGLEVGKRFARLDEPWSGFLNQVRNQVERIVVSHRVSKKVSGALHKETNYSTKDLGDAENVRRHRVELRDLSATDVISDDVIADPGVRKLVQEKL